MKFILLITLLTFSLFGKNPQAYAILGDEIYDNVSKIEKLKDIHVFKGFSEKIDMYVSSVAQTKALGFGVASGKRSNVKLDYLHQLRTHKKVNDYFLRSANNAFKSALDNKDSTLFIDVVNNGLIDTRARKKEIMSYYQLHKAEINPAGVIQEFIDEDLAWKNRKRWKPKTKKQLQEEKIARLRKNDKLDQEALEKHLSDEVREKKQKIREKQEKELFN